MKKIGPKNSSQELYIRKLVRHLGYSFILHSKDLPGTPDLVFLSRHKVIFIHGCFWHGHPRCKRLPKTNINFWKEKIRQNKLRDGRNYRKLNRRGWHYLCLWQCKIRKKSEKILRNKIVKFLSS